MLHASKELRTYHNRMTVPIASELEIDVHIDDYRPVDCSRRYFMNLVSNLQENISLTHRNVAEVGICWRVEG